MQFRYHSEPTITFDTPYGCSVCCADCSFRSAPCAVCSNTGSLHFERLSRVVKKYFRLHFRRYTVCIYLPANQWIPMMMVYYEQYAAISWPVDRIAKILGIKCDSFRTNISFIDWKYLLDTDGIVIAIIEP